MTLNESINAVYQKAASQQWSYPQLFEGLKAAGVHSYNTTVTSHTLEYFGEKESVIHHGPADFEANVGQFNQAEVINAIRRAQRRETNYPTFLKEIAAAGISHYRVDMAERTVSYFGQDVRNKYIEKVP